MSSINNKVIVITGGSSGIGKALALECLKSGAQVAVCSRNLEKLHESLPKQEEIFTFKADVSEENECKSFMEAVIEKWGRIDILINNAGISMRALFEDTELRVLRELMDVNFWGTVYCTKYALPSILKTKGIIIGVSSIAGYRGLPGRTGYSASKFAMQGFLEALRTELLYTGVHVMWVSPGFTSSNIRTVARNAEGKSQQETPLDEKKLMSAEECARIILNAAIKRKRTHVMTIEGKLTLFLNKFFPKLTDKLIYRHFLNETNSPLNKYKTTIKK